MSQTLQEEKYQELVGCLKSQKSETGGQLQWNQCGPPNKRLVATSPIFRGNCRLKDVNLWRYFQSVVGCLKISEICFGGVGCVQYWCHCVIHG